MLKTGQKSIFEGTKDGGALIQWDHIVNFGKDGFPVGGRLAAWQRRFSNEQKTLPQEKSHHFFTFFNFFTFFTGDTKTPSIAMFTLKL